MINYLPFVGNKGAAQNLSDPKNNQNIGRFDMMDSASSEDIEIDAEANAESASLIDKTQKQAKEQVDKMTEKAGEMAGNVQKAVEAKTGDLSQPNYVWMAVFFAAGCLFLLAAVTSLPFILISPAGFNMYFSLASACLLISVSFYYGPLNYLKTLFEKKNIMISALYVGSTLASLWAIFAGAGYLWSIGLVILQATSVAFFLMQVVAGGEAAQHKLAAMLKSGTQNVQASVVQNVMQAVITKSTGSNNLPL